MTIARQQSAALNPFFSRTSALAMCLMLSICSWACGGGRTTTQSQTVSTPTAMSGWRSAIDELATQLSNNLKATEVIKVAILDFTTVQGDECDLGGVIAEELTTRLFASERFEIIERRQLAQVLSEQKMSASDLLDPNSVARIGRLMGATAVATGTVAVSGTRYHLNARIILVESGTIVSVGQAEIERIAGTEPIASCGGSVPIDSGSVGTKVPLEKPDLSASTRVPAERRDLSGTGGHAGSFLYYEDFSQTSEQDAPVGWTGPVAVRSVDGRRTLACYRVGGGEVVEYSQQFLLPANFRLTVVGAFDWRRGAVFSLNSARPVYIYTEKNLTRVGMPGPNGLRWQNAVAPFPQDRVVTVVFERVGAVTRLLLDDKVVAFERDHPSASRPRMAKRFMKLTFGRYANGAVGACADLDSLRLRQVSLEGL